MTNDELLNAISKYEVFKEYITYISPLGKVKDTLLSLHMLEKKFNKLEQALILD